MIGVIFLVVRFMIAASLYLFLGWAFLALWRDMSQQRQFLLSQRLPTLALTLRLGNETHQEALSGPEILIGRDPSVQMRIDSETVSARHARLSYHHDQWWVEDLGSTNGTLLNGGLVTSPTVIARGDQLQCGEARLEIHFG